MKRVALLCMGLVLGAATAAEAQLTMQMSNGWSFTFAGNVNAFVTYETFADDGSTAGVIVPAAGESETRIRTGLLPAFAVFDAKGKEGNTDLGVHFGFAPQINCGTGVHDCFGAQIDMRQVFLTVGGTWGQVLAGRELGLFGRQNILTDQTLFGVGATGSAVSRLRRARHGRRHDPRPHRVRLQLPAVQGPDDLFDRRRPAARSSPSGSSRRPPTAPMTRSRFRGSRPKPYGTQRTATRSCGRVGSRRPTRVSRPTRAPRPTA